MIDRDVEVRFNLIVGNTRELQRALNETQSALSSIGKQKILDEKQISRAASVFKQAKQTLHEVGDEMLYLTSKTSNLSNKAIGDFKKLNKTIKDVTNSVKTFSSYLGNLSTGGRTAYRFGGNSLISSIAGTDLTSANLSVQRMNRSLRDRVAITKQLANAMKIQGVTPRGSTLWSESRIMSFLGIQAPLSASSYGGKNTLKNTLNAWRNSGLISNSNLYSGRVVSTATRIPSIVNEIPNVNYSLSKQVATNLGTQSTSNFESVYQKVVGWFGKMGSAGTGSAQQVTRSWEQVRQSIMNVGTAIQSVGNAFTTLGNATGIPTLVNRFQYLFTGTAYGALSSGISAGTSRFDTMRTFPLLLKGMGENPANAKVAVNKLDMAVRGLPTALNDIVDSTKNLFSINGDLDRATNLAIAMNNAFLSSGATQQQVYFGTQQLRDLLATGTLMDREWISLGKSAPLALKKVASAMGYSSFKAMYSDIGDNQDKIDEFFDTLIQLGTGTGELVKLADVQKTTIAGLGANIKNAFSRFVGGDNGLLSIADDFAKQYLGAESLVQYLYGITAWIDDFSAKTRGAVFANSDRILGLIRGLTNYDWFRLISEIAKFEFAKWEIKLKIFEAIGPTLYAIAGTWFPVIGRLLQGAGSIVKILGAVGGVAIFGKLGGFFKGFGKFSKVVSSVAPARTSANLLPAMKNFAIILGGIAAIGATAGITSAGLRVGMENLKVIGEITGDINWNQVANALGGLAVFASIITLTGVMAKGSAGTVAGAIALGGALSAMIAGFAAIDAWLIRKAFDNIKIISENMLDIVDNLKKVSSKLSNIGSLNVSNFQKVVEFINGFYDMFATSRTLDVGIWDMDGMIGKGESNNILTIVQNMTTSIQAFSKVARLIGNMTTVSEYQIQNFKTIVQELVGLMVWMYDMRAADQFGNEGEGARIFSGNKFKKMSKSVSNLNSVVDSLSQIIGTVANLSGTLAKLFSKAKGSKNLRHVNIRERMESLIADISEIATAANIFFGNKSHGQQVTNSKGIFGRERWENGTFDAGKLKKNLESLSSIVSSVASVATTMDGMISTLAHLFTKAKGSSKDRIEKVVTRFKELIGSVWQIVGSIDEGSAYDPKNPNKNLTWKQVENADSNFSHMLGVIESLTKVATSLDGMIGTLSHLAGSGKGSKNSRMENLSSRFQDLVGYVNEMVAKVNEYDWTVTGDMSNVITVLENMQKVISKLQSIRKKIPDSDAVEGLTKTIRRVKRIINSLNTNLSSDGEEGSPMVTVAAWTALATSVANLINTLSNAGKILDDGGIVKAFEAVREEMKKFRTAISKTSEKVADIGTKWTDGIVNALDSQRVAEAVNAVIAQFQLTEARIGALQFYGTATASTYVNAIQSYLSGSTLTLPRPSGFAGGISSLVSHDSQGGIIYRAFGGNIFKPKGTDTVPAMLTPGEYVTRRSAVDAVGKEFMDRVNALDFRGALTALSKRVGMGMIPGVSPSFTFTSNETTNHNGTINFYTTTNNPDYPQQVSGKWIRKLV